jgi:hypothetical protein
LVRRSSLVHTFSPSIFTSFMCRANDFAYFLPRGERFVSPPIRPNTLFSLSPCYANNIELLHKHYTILILKNKSILTAILSYMYRGKDKVVLVLNYVPCHEYIQEEWRYSSTHS